MRFADNQEIENTIILTWDNIRVFFRNQQQLFSNGVLTSFLLEQFEEFCTINCIGSDKTYEYFFLNFENAKAQELARKVHQYIWHESGFKEVEDANTKDGIGYKKVGQKNLLH